MPVDSAPEISSETIRSAAVSAEGKTVADAVSAARAVLDERRVCLVRGFPTEPEKFLEFLRGFGKPLDNYSSRSELADDDPHPQINRVKFKPAGQYTRKSVHYSEGELRPHSARSWRTPRPAYFGMLMVEPGWCDTPEGRRGESLVLSWRHLFTRLAERDGDTFARHFDRLTKTSIRFAANNVREEFADLPLCYQLPDAADAYDVGVRLKQDITQKLPDLADQIEGYDAYAEAVDYLVTNAADHAFQACFPMASGDLLMIDNNRMAHGRRDIVGTRGEEINPRELWSVTVE
ncbi:TfdA family taurine catabolism dioxygenase TauD [Nocardia tenerifensis]|uniref:TfdA family taurine catabolism dioxygenase TauD n=1 Tax=Nocardia tenerifensis TaxID=228006 RepID=A0A318JSQ0_9NOCA|nr:TauD/TfdA family dioxygenase [Nocardia tenerifensis]PXX58139.1 TfdA family taurine catabolism dioxygenase TauD [Nocardia tenerifensis]